MKQSEKSKFAEISDPKKTADIIGMSAVFIQDMSGRREKGYTFDLKRATSFEGDTGPYLQYAHSRLCSIEKKFIAKYYPNLVDSPITDIIELDNINFRLLSEKETHELAYQIGRFPYAIYNAYTYLEPSAIVSYLFDLCHSFSSANSKMHVLNAEEETGKARLMLFHSARVVLGRGLKLLGLKPLTIM